jgi:hypothetical protein
MDQYSQRLESVPQSDHYHDSQFGLPWPHSHKVKVFAVSSATVLVLGLLWTLLQPSVYRSEATVLMSALDSFDAMASEVNIQKVVIQRTILLCSGLMEPDTFMRDNIVNHRGVIYDAKAQLQAVSERV